MLETVILMRFFSKKAVVNKILNNSPGFGPRRRIMVCGAYSGCRLRITAFIQKSDGNLAEKVVM